MVETGLLVLSVFPTLLALGGLGMVYRTYQGRQQAAAIDDLDPSPVADIEAGAGVTAISGAVRPAADDPDLVSATMLDTDGVYVSDEVQERHAAPADENRPGSDWETVTASTQAIPFVVDDGSGSVPVRIPEAGSVSVAAETIEVEPGSEPPPGVMDWLAETDGIEAAPKEYRAYKQGVIEAGEEVYAVGEAVTDGGGLVFTGKTHPEEFVVTDRSQSALSEDSGYGLGGYAFGAVLFVVGAAPLAYLWLG